MLVNRCSPEHPCPGPHADPEHLLLFGECFHLAERLATPEEVDEGREFGLAYDVKRAAPCS